MNERKVNARTIARWQHWFELMNAGVGVQKACTEARISLSSGRRFVRGDQTVDGVKVAAILGVTMVDGFTVARPLNENAARALADFEYFRLHYLGRKSTPWQVRAAEEILRAYQSDIEEYIVINVSPGAGKSTLLSDIELWLICIDRSIRIQIGSRTMTQVRDYVKRIRRSLERSNPIQASLVDLRAGTGFDAEGCLSEDYGIFKPPDRSEVWAADQFTVRPLDGIPVEDKEPTVVGIAQDSGFLGKRCNIVVWDDLSDIANTRTDYQREQTINWWDSQAESRIEPGGVVLVVGQRIAGNDLYNYCLAKRNPDDTPMYRHIVYKAHYEELCKGEHGLDTPPWPNGCLLDPKRLSWKKLERIQHTTPKVFTVQYQQDDGEVPTAFVEKQWIYGGVDTQNFDAPGCLDKDRRLDEVPPHLADREHWSYLTVDPAQSSGWWGIVHRVWDPETNRQYIINLWRRKMNQPDWLNVDLDAYGSVGVHAFSGLLVDIRSGAAKLGYPINDLIFEANAAQKWFSTMPHVQKYLDLTGLRLHSHLTQKNKLNADWGVESLGNDFRQGLIRIPWADIAARNVMGDLLHEVLRYGEADTTDLLMSLWFGRIGVERYYTPAKFQSYQIAVPEGFLSGTEMGMPRW